MLELRRGNNEYHDVTIANEMSESQAARGSSDRQCFSSSQPLRGGSGTGPESSVQICINDISMESADEEAAEDADDESPMIDDEEAQIRLEEVRKQRRRSSWCPEEERKKEDKEEKQKMLVALGGRRCDFSFCHVASNLFFIFC